MSQAPALAPGKLVFPNAEGIDLAGRLEMPDGEPLAYAIFAHCFTCSKDIAAATRISRGLAKKGLAACRTWPKIRNKSWRQPSYRIGNQVGAV